jgi:lipid-binding SYLF domain-containing protein
MRNFQENTVNRNLVFGAAAALAIAASGCSTTASYNGASSGDPATGAGAMSMDKKHEIDEAYRDTLSRLYDTTPGSRELVAKARGVLVFPRVLGAGLIVGGQFGEGELRVDNSLAGYYKTTTGSVGWQIGAESRALVFLFMTQDSLDKFRSSNGWAGGVDASVALLKLGANGAVDVNAARAPTIAFVMANAGLMANLSLEGTKVTRIQ